MKSLSFKKFSILAVLFVMSFSLMSFHPKNNFRIEKRHYRKGYYVDIWKHPKTYPQTSPRVAAQPVKAADTNSGSEQQDTSVKQSPPPSSVNPPPAADNTNSTGRSIQPKNISVAPKNIPVNEPVQIINQRNKL
jgi:hypothetical protein